MHELIDLSKFPSMPAPFQSEEPGEAWLWGDFFVILQVRPKTVAHAMQHVMKLPPASLPPLEYPFVMTAFYRLHKNPHGPSHRPILAATLERINYAAAAAKLGGNAAALKELGLAEPPVMKGLFSASGRYNYGEFHQPLSVENVRAYFFELLRPSLKTAEEPLYLGTIDDVHGNPETGWPERKKSAKGKFGCLIFLTAITGLAAGACAALIAMF